MDPDRVLQTLTNLISNAVKFSAPDSVVLVGVEVRAGAATFRVTDHGRGIPADKRETIFERFQQVDASDSRDKGGTGLGLAICRSIVEQHGGRIWVEETEGGGSTFVFSVPTSAGTVSVVQPSPSVPRLAGGPREERRADHVLVVEDDPHLCEVLNGSLEKHGVTTFTVGTIAAAKAAIEEIPPAMILLDLGLPDGDGTELLVWLGEHRCDPGIPIIVYTAQHLSAAHRELILLHHAEIHTKGRTDTETLASMVARHLATHTVRALGETA